MRRDQLEHAIRAACQIIQQSEVIVVGSQAILGTYDSLLPAARNDVHRSTSCLWPRPTMRPRDRPA